MLPWRSPLSKTGVSMLLPIVRIVIAILISFGLGLLAGSGRRSKLRRSSTQQYSLPLVSQPHHPSESITFNPSSLATFDAVEVETLQTNIKTLEQTNQQLSLENTTLSHQYTEVTHVLNVTERALGETQRQLEAKQLELDRYVEKFDLDDERQTLAARCLSLEGTVSILEKQVTESQEFIECLKLEKQDLQSEKQDLEVRQQALYQQIEEISHYGAQSRDIKPEYQKDFILKSNEGNLYDHEKKNLIIKILNVTFQGMERIKSPRRYDILKDILEQNQSTNYDKELRANLAEILKGFKHLSKKQKHSLENLGFEISEDGEHYNMWLNGDRRYRISLAKTPSDRRAGLNAVRDFLKVLL